MKKILIKALFIISALLISCSYFLWIYSKIGFVFTVDCLFSWGFCVLAYATCLWIFFILIGCFEAD